MVKVAVINNITIECDVDPELVLDEIDISDVVNYLGIEDLLNEIGENAAVEHFGLELAE